MSFSGFFLLGGGFSNTQIGIIAAAASIISALLQPVLAGYADRPDSPSLKKIIQILYVIQLLLGIGLFFSRTLILTGLLYGISIALLQLMTPFINALGMESINQGQKLNFGLARGMGSVAYAVICYVLGIITVKAGVLSIPASVTIITVLSLGCLIIFPFVKTQKSAQTSSDSKSLANPLLFFRKYRRFSLVLIGCIFIYLSHVLLNNFNFQIAQSKGGATATSHGRVFIVEIMGHKVGSLTLHAGIAGGADIILIPEIPYDIKKVCSAIEKRNKEGKRFTILAVAEGAISKEDAELPKKKYKEKLEARAKKYPSVSYEIADQINQVIGSEVRVTVPGHIQRGGEPCPYDRVLSTRIGAGAAEAILDEEYGIMIGIINGKIKRVPLAECAGKLKMVSPKDQIVKAAKQIGISFGD